MSWLSGMIFGAAAGAGTGHQAGTQAAENKIREWQELTETKAQRRRRLARLAAQSATEARRKVAEEKRWYQERAKRQKEVQSLTRLDLIRAIATPFLLIIAIGYGVYEISDTLGAANTIISSEAANHTGPGGSPLELVGPMVGILGLGLVVYMGYQIVEVVNIIRCLRGTYATGRPRG